MSDGAFAQDSTAVASTAPKAKSLWTLFIEGGWIMWPLLLISMWCTALIIECFVRIRISNFVPLESLAQIKAAFAEENYQQAWRVCKSKSSFLTNVLRYSLERIGRGRAATESAIAEHSLKEGMLFRTKISYLSTIGVISPMVGLLGTVTGMIRAFHELGHGGISDPSRLAAAIGEVLIATASGLIVAIPAFFLYYFFRNRLLMVVVLAEDAINQLMVDVKYDELQGIRIGDVLENEIVDGSQGKTNESENVQTSGATMECPQCKAPIAASSPKCASCGSELHWE